MLAIAERLLAIAERLCKKGRKMNCERLKKLIDDSGKSRQQISDESGIAISTINRLLQGGNPSVDTLTKILETIGKTLSDMDDKLEATATAPLEETLKVYRDYIAENKERTAELERRVAERELDIKRRDIKISILSGALILLMAVVAGILIVDMTNLNIGIIQIETRALIYVAAAIVAVFIGVTIAILFVKRK